MAGLESSGSTKSLQSSEQKPLLIIYSLIILSILIFLYISLNDESRLKARTIFIIFGVLGYIGFLVGLIKLIKNKEPKNKIITVILANLVLMVVIGAVFFYSENKLRREIVLGTLGVLVGIGILGSMIKNKNSPFKKYITKQKIILLVKLLIIFMFFYSTTIASLQYDIEPAYSKTLKNISKSAMLDFSNNSPSANPTTFESIINNGLNNSQATNDNNTYTLSDNSQSELNINLYKTGFSISIITIIILLGLIIYTIKQTSSSGYKEYFKLFVLLLVLAIPIILSISLPISFIDFTRSMDSIFTLTPTSDSNCQIETKKENIFKTFIIIISFFILFFIYSKYIMEYNNYGSILNEWIKKDFLIILFIMIIMTNIKVYHIFFELKKKIQSKIYGTDNIVDSSINVPGVNENKNKNKIYNYLYNIVSEENKSNLARMILFVFLLFIIIIMYFFVNYYNFNLHTHIKTRLDKLDNKKLNFFIYPAIFGLLGMINLGFSLSM